MFVCRGSLFIHPIKADGDSVADRFDDPEWWQRYRYVALFEFSFSGEYRRLIKLPLLDLDPLGSSRVTKRVPGSLKVGQQYFHYFETLETTEFSRPVRIDYLFDRAGKVKATWSNEPFAHDHRPAGYPPIPHPSLHRPDFLLGDGMISLRPEWPDRTPEERDYAYSYIERITFVEIEKWIHALEKLVPYKLDPRSDRTREDTSWWMLKESLPAQDVTLEMPVADGFCLDRVMTRKWSSSVSDGKRAWLYSIQNFLVWSAEFVNGLPVFSPFNLPHPYDLIRQEFIQVSFRGDLDWVPKDEDYARLASKGFRERELPQLAYSLVAASNNRLLLMIAGDIIAFEVTEQALKPVKNVSHFFENWVADHLYANTDPGAFRRTPSDLDSPFQLEGTKLFATTRDWDRKLKIIMVDFDRESVEWFSPTIPRNMVDDSLASLLERE